VSEINFLNIFNQDDNIKRIIPKLLKDQTTGRNIVWATDTYQPYGSEYEKQKQMNANLSIKLIKDGIMLPRIMKTKEQQDERTKDKAEVFTPSWICNKMNNYCDEQWFNRKNVFNIENSDNTWTTINKKIEFDNDSDKAWQKYVDSRRIEITCGEAPYIVSRYDATTGENLKINDRIGILDRKLRIVNENANNEEEWLKWTYRSYESVYGFEFQGDNLLFARLNLVQTFIDYYTDRFSKEPTDKMIDRIANIVSWNLWQMDGLRDTIPFETPKDEFQQISFYDFFANAEKTERSSVYCKIKDWRSNKIIEYRSMKGSR
jgi:type II restriction enzyme